MVMAGRDAPPDIIVIGDILVRDRPGEAREEYDTIMATRHEAAQKVWSKAKQGIHRGKDEDGDPLQLVGTTQEVADQILRLREATGLTGIMFRMPLWGASEGERIAPVLDRLEAEGVWKRPSSRSHSW